MNDLHSTCGRWAALRPRTFESQPSRQIPKLKIKQLLFAISFFASAIGAPAISQAQTFQELNTLPGYFPFDVYPGALNSDGGVAAASECYQVPCTAGTTQAVLWTQGNPTALGFLPQNQPSSYMRGINGDGSVAVGASNYDPTSLPNCHNYCSQIGIQAVISQFGNPVQGLGFLPTPSSTLPASKATAVNTAGTLVVGESTSIGDNGANAIQAFVWQTVGGMQGLGYLPSAPLFTKESHAYAVGNAGLIIVGSSSHNSTGGLQAVRWNLGQIEALGFLNSNDSQSEALATSNDGQIVVGYSGGRAFRWSYLTGMIDLGILDLGLANTVTRALSINADGSVVTGVSGGHAFRWTAETGIRSIESLLAEIGFPNWTVHNAPSISGDGSAILIEGSAPGGPSCTPCILRLGATIPLLQVTPSNNVPASGVQGGPFAPSSIPYSLSTTGGSVGYSISMQFQSGLPNWLTAPANGTATTSATTASFAVNPAANGLTPGTYTATITFTPSGNSQSAITRGVTLMVNPQPALQVSPGTNIVASGTQGGPFAPSSFQYQLSASSGSVDYSISGVPNWLTASSTSGTVTTSATTITLSVNSNANSLVPNTYGPATITFTATNGSGTTTRTATLTVNPVSSATLVLSPATNIVASGNLGGPFSPSSFQYQLSASSGSLNYSISGVPNWLTASSTSGSATVSGTTITFTVNSNAIGFNQGTYGPNTITVTNTSNGAGNTTRTAKLTVNGAPANDNFANAFTINLGQTKTGDNTLATRESGEPLITGNPGGNSLWWNFKPASSGPVLITTAGSTKTGGGLLDTLLGVYTGTAVNALHLITENDDTNGSLNAAVTFNAVAGTTYHLVVDSYGGGIVGSGNVSLGVFDNSTPGSTSIVSAVAPISRATTVGNAVTAYASIINAGSVTATSCSLALPAGVPATFSYQTTNVSNTPIGTPNTPVNIPGHGTQGFYFIITPTQAMSQEIAVIFDCTNTNPAPVYPGINTFSLTAGASIADVLIATATAPSFGILDMSDPSSTSAFTAAAINIGPSATLTFTPTDTAIGQLPSNEPLSLLLCQIDPNTAQCINPASPASSSTVTVNTNQTVYFGIFVIGQGTYIPFDIPNNRVYIQAKQSSTPLAQGSVAVRMTSSAGANRADVPSKSVASR